MEAIFPLGNSVSSVSLLKESQALPLVLLKTPGVEYDDINSGEGTLNKDVRLKVGTKKRTTFRAS